MGKNLKSKQIIFLNLKGGNHQWLLFHKIKSQKMIFIVSQEFTWHFWLMHYSKISGRGVKGIQKVKEI